jgi:transposase
MIPHGVEVFVALQPVDLRWGFDRLAGLVEERVGRPARSGALFVFFGKRRTALKVLFYDGTGLCLFYKRLDRGTFQLPLPSTESETCLVVEERVLEDLLDGISVEARAPGRVPQRRRGRLH